VLSHASVHADRNCRDGLPVRDFALTVSLAVASIILRLTVGVVHQVAAGENPWQVGAGARRMDEDVTLVVQVYLTSD